MIMNARVTVGDLEFTAINSFSIKENVNETSDQATVTLARNYKELAGHPILKHIRSGQPILIEAGYNGQYNTEFSGYIKPGVSASDFPVVLECDELYPLRQTNHVLSYKSITLKELLHKIAPGYTIEAIDVKLGKVAFNNRSSFQILNDIKKDFGFFSRINGNILHVGYAFDFKPSFTKQHDFIVGKNVKDLSSLKFLTQQDFNTRVEIAVSTTSGKKKIYKFGSNDSDAAVKKYSAGFMDTKAAQNKAESIYHQYTYDGYRGNIVGFGFPLVHAGDSIRIIDQVHPERDATLLVEKMDLEYDESYIQRTCSISYKVA